MESKWRMNVHTFGWVGGPFRLIARFLTAPGFAVTDVRDGAGNAVMVLRNGFDESDWVTTPTQLIAVADIPFPYELGVESD